MLHCSTFNHQFEANKVCDNDWVQGGTGDGTFYGDVLHEMLCLKTPFCMVKNSPRENHAFASHIDTGSQRWCNNVGLKSGANQAKIHTYANNKNDWRIAARNLALATNKLASAKHTGY